MNETRLRLDRVYVKRKLCKDISKEIDYVFDNLEKVNKALIKTKAILNQVEHNKTILARGFVIQIGVLLTKKQFEKRYIKETKANTRGHKNKRGKKWECLIVLC